MEVQCDPLDDPAPGKGVGAECKGAPTIATATSHPAKRRKTRRVRPPFLFCTAPSSPVSPLSQRTAASCPQGPRCRFCWYWRKALRLSRYFQRLLMRPQKSPPKKRMRFKKAMTMDSRVDQLPPMRAMQ